MLEICGKYREEFSVEYSPTKTVCVVFSRRKVEVKTSVELCGATLKWVDKSSTLVITYSTICVKQKKLP